QEVVQEGNYIYVVGSHLGTKTQATTIAAKTSLSYNRTTSQPNDHFVHNPPSSPITTSSEGHLYVAKLDLDGTKIWQGLYGSENYTGTGSTAFGVYSDGRDIILNSSNGLLYTV